MGIRGKGEVEEREEGIGGAVWEGCKKKAK